MMKIFLMALLVLNTLPVLAKETKPMTSSTSEKSTDQKAAEFVVLKYMDALHAADVETIMSLYDENAVFLPADGPTFVGKTMIRESYLANFKIMNVPDGQSTVEEATVHGNLAVVRLATKSTVLMLANNAKIPVNARELFILNKSDGQFKISQYMFNKSN